MTNEMKIKIATEFGSYVNFEITRTEDEIMAKDTMMRCWHKENNCACMHNTYGYISSMNSAIKDASYRIKEQAEKMSATSKEVSSAMKQLKELREKVKQFKEDYHRMWNDVCENYCNGIYEDDFVIHVQRVVKSVVTDWMITHTPTTSCEDKYSEDNIKKTVRLIAHTIMSYHGYQIDDVIIEQARRILSIDTIDKAISQKNNTDGKDKPVIVARVESKEAKGFQESPRKIQLTIHECDDERKSKTIRIPVKITHCTDTIDRKLHDNPREAEQYIADN